MTKSKMNRLNVDVESVEINFPSSKFKNGFTLQDTPGVDSNVATHQLQLNNSCIPAIFCSIQ